MTENITISIIVAVYNAEKYLKQCLESLLFQQLKEIEIICVNDASTDASATILDEYCKRDERIVVLTHEVNKGIAKTRNDALMVA